MCDVRSATSIANSVQRIIDDDTRIDILINNAEVWLQGEIQNASAEEVKRVFEVNTIGTIFVMQAVLPVMLK
jgi:NADP-dependent 3-hydroxy acid dehydrogenase YdfG